MLGQVPDADGPVFAGRGELGPIGTERDAKDAARVAAQDLGGRVVLRFCCRGRGLTSQIRTVPSCPAEASLVAVRAKGDAGGPAFMTAEDMEQLPSSHVPDLHLAIGTGRGHADSRSIEGHAVGGAVRAVHAAEFRTARGVPD